ncbi:methylated-DNA--[protein]-cysteine S-methyltransferase [Methylobacillus gramineus]|uniref:methylated-DNA--[protein]-cysteine S-methyltransferase n=1 Tax=Methylobacillus gramineus TaxID=755169 RepID=UPI001CFFC398|nr:methylated-DNA--[protein]-cysteine S-methyltransferase [Methylobacillus gramineus]MCB5186118.1 methylated-DNA--[protein]-cysteine S-methyltransferase [Methylobacillus gramineus]
MANNIPQNFSAVIEAPFGAIGVYVDDEYVSGIKLIPEHLSACCASQPFVQYVALQLKRYLQDASTSLDIPHVLQGTPFQKRVWRKMNEIPLGQVWSYSELAEQVASGPRAVANVCGANHLPLLIPCHRIVAKNGIGGFMQGTANGLDIKRWLLQHEKQV